MKPKRVRLRLRIISISVALFFVFAVVWSVSAILAGSRWALLNLVLHLFFVAEFAVIAWRGDGLWLIKADRINKEREQARGVKPPL